MVLTYPTILEDYYDEIEENTFTLKKERILEDSEYIIGELSIDEWYSDYTKSEIRELKRFATLLRNNLTTAIVIHRY